MLSRKLILGCFFFKKKWSKTREACGWCKSKGPSDGPSGGVSGLPSLSKLLDNVR